MVPAAHCFLQQAPLHGSAIPGRESDSTLAIASGGAERMKISKALTTLERSGRKLVPSGSLTGKRMCRVRGSTGQNPHNRPKVQRAR